MATRISLLVLCLLFAVFNMASPGLLNANSVQSDWLKAPPSVHDQFDLGNGDMPFSINGNLDCMKQRIITKPAKVLPYWPYLQNEEAHESCIINTGYGAVSQSGYLQTAGQTTFGKVYYPWGGTITLLPIPRSAQAIYITPNPPNGVGLHLIRDFISNIDGYTLASGEVEYRVKSGTSITSLKDGAGNVLGVQLDSVSFSNSGKWMVADIPVLGLSRIDTSSLSIKTFDSSFNYSIGVAPGVQSAITNRGHYVTVSSPSFTRFRLYDLEDCPTASLCRYVDLYKYFTANTSGFVSGVRLRFSSDYSLRMYMVQRNGSSNKIIRQTLRASGHETTGFGYLGLGDSFASGEGAYQYKSSTDNGVNKCHLSFRSYPYLIANELGINEAESVACSGAVIEDINSGSFEYRGQTKDKIKRQDWTEDEVDQIIGAFSPGYITQLEQLSHHDPEVITISTVGNDIGFADKIKVCLMPGTCFNSYEDRLEIANEINNQFGRLVGMFADIKTHMDGKKVYVIGYPEIAMDNGACGGNVRLDSHEIKFSNQLVRHLNKMIKAAADNVGFYYVDVEKAFYGHRLCEASYPEEAINGITGGDDIVNLPFTDFGGPIGNESFHPNDLGHRKFKETILAKTNNFTMPMPKPNSTSKPPHINDSTELLAGMKKSGRLIKTIIYAQDLTESNIFYREQVITGGIDVMKSTFKPSSIIEAWVHSEPIKLGEFTTDTIGGLTFTASLPDDIPYGFHTIHLFGTDLFNKPVDVQKVIYVAETPVIDLPLNTSPVEPDETREEIEQLPDDNSPETSPEPEKQEPVEYSVNTKPPQNNPETVAGHENSNNVEEIDQAPQIAVSEPTYATDAYEVSPQESRNAQPAVAGIHTSSSSVPPTTENTSPPRTSPSHKRIVLMLILFPALILFLVLFRIVRRN